MNPLDLFSDFLFLGSKFHRALYQKNILREVNIPQPVVSVGNLTVGGTGKTPFLDFWLNYCQQQKINCAVVSRSYKTPLAEARKILFQTAVDAPTPEGAKTFGDEAYFLASKYRQFPVYTGPSKSQNAQLASQQEKFQLLWVDDGFQHYRLHKDLNWVLLDATETPENYRAFPLGRAREPLATLQKADAIFLTKCNWAPPKNLQFHREICASLKKTFFEFNWQLDFSPKEKFLFVSGIARPSQITDQLKIKFAEDFCVHLPFSDHYNYQASDIQKMLEKMKKHQLKEVWTTEKDFAKLILLWPKDVILNVARVSLQEQSDLTEAREQLRRLCL